MVSPMTRRDVIRYAAAVAAGATAATALGACGGGDPQAPAAAAPAQPRRGGTLRVAIAGGGAAETLNPFTGTSPAEFARNRIVYDLLFGQDNGKTVPRLATAAVPASDGKSFTLTIRDGVKWHDGSPFTTQDVVFALRAAVDPSLPYPSALAQYLDATGIQAVDGRTVRVPLNRPVGDPATLLAASQTFMVKAGTTSYAVGDIVGTGPYRITSFQAGRSSTLQRYDGYWEGAPYLDEITFLGLDDANARVNAVLAGQADYATAVPYAAAKTVPGGRGVEVRTAGDADRTGYGLVLNATRAPFSDPRARRAVRLGIDRQALVNTVFLGYGAVGNDLYGAGSTYYDGDVSAPTRDVAGARQLLADAGASGAEVVVRSAEIEDGDNASATLFAEQLKQLGLRPTTQVVTPAQFGDIQAMGQANAVVLSMGAYPLQTIYTQLSLIPPFALGDPEYQSSIESALATPDSTARAAAWKSAQQILADRGNLVVWGFGDTLSLSRGTVRGVVAWGTAKYPYFAKAWLA
jgi:peptide/nickel transport system substrate-binding protein